MKILISLLCNFLLVAVSFGQSIRYVKPVANGSGDGTSWLNESANIQAMLDLSGVNEVWVAAGTYKPTGYPTGCSNCLTSRDNSFLIPANKKLVGGFAGSESSINQRNILANETILSGDIGNVGVDTDNTYHVVVAPFAFAANLVTEIDGFTITGGNNIGSSGTVTINGVFLYRTYGAGIYYEYGSKVIANCKIINNHSASFGGGVFSNNKSTSSMTANNCEFVSNSANRGAGMSANYGNNLFEACLFSQNVADTLGGGIYINLSGLFTVNNCSVLNNQSADGAGIFSYLCLPKGTISNSEFIDNVASRYGGGIQTHIGNYEVINNTFSGNSSTNGGAAYVYKGTNVYRNNIFRQNLTTVYGGGGIFFVLESDNLVEKNFFIENYGHTSGGAIGLAQRTNNTTIQNNLFLSNSARYWGGGISITTGINNVVNNTFVKNSTPYGGGSAIYTGGGTNKLTNNIFWANMNTATTTVTGADYINNNGINTFKNNAMQLASSAYTTTATGDYHLGTSSSGNLICLYKLKNRKKNWRYCTLSSGWSDNYLET